MPMFSLALYWLSYRSISPCLPSIKSFHASIRTLFPKFSSSFASFLLSTESIDRGPVSPHHRDIASPRCRQRNLVLEMPYSDNLYSADVESDAESFSDELSPTDGYFNRRDIPREILVPDPSQSSNSSDDKDELARQEARQNSEVASRTTGSPTLSNMYPSLPDASAATSVRTPSSPVSNTPSSPVSSRRTDDLYSESTPLMHAPPPAYSASPTLPLAPVFPDPRNYSTFAPHQLEQGLPSRQEPESMGGPVDIPNERTPLSISHSEGSSLPPFKTRRSSPCRTLIRKLLFLALVVTVVVLLLTTMLHSKSNVC